MCEGTLSNLKQIVYFYTIKNKLYWVLKKKKKDEKNLL